MIENLGAKAHGLAQQHLITDTGKPSVTRANPAARSAGLCPTGRAIDPIIGQIDTGAQPKTRDGIERRHPADVQIGGIILQTATQDERAEIVIVIGAQSEQDIIASQCGPCRGKIGVA